MPNTEQEETLISHLEALRATLLKCFASLAIMLVPMFLFAPYFMNLLIKVMLQNTPLTLNFYAPMEVFILQLKTALVLDILICFPYIAKQVWDFVSPALYENERYFIKSLVFSSSFLFIIGVLFCLFFILPLVIRFGMSFVTDNLRPLFGISNLITLALWLSIVFGLMFQFPLITYALIKSNIVTYQTMRHKRPYIFLGILVLSALLTPPDIVSQLMLSLPTYGLFEIGLFFGKK